MVLDKSGKSAEDFQRVGAFFDRFGNEQTFDGIAVAERAALHLHFMGEKAGLDAFNVVGDQIVGYKRNGQQTDIILGRNRKLYRVVGP